MKKTSLIILMSLIFLFSLTSIGITNENPHGFKAGSFPYGFKAGEGPLPLPVDSDEQLVRYNKQGIESFLKKDYKAAVQNFQAGGKLNPTSAILLYNEGITLDRLDQHKKATLRFQQAKNHAKENSLILESPILQAHLP